MLAELKSTDKILDTLPNVLNGKNVEIPTVDFAKKEIEIATQDDIKIILHSDSEYPESLKSIYNKPVLLYAKGNVKLLQNNCVAIVGTRNPSITSKNFITETSRYISQNNFTVVSGMALGIDASAHIGAITETQANTIAVLGGGVNNIYPITNKKLYQEIANKNGLILSDQPINYTAKASDFPKRNRIIAGLSCALILTEATEKSGSLITARYAMEQGKLIYAIPSHPSDARSYGPNKLISSGAKIFSSAQNFISDLQNVFANNNGKICNPILYDKHIINSIKDIDDEFENIQDLEPQNIRTDDEKAYQYILNMLSSYPVNTEIIFQEIKNKFALNISKFSEIILQLELNGQILNINGQLTKI
jgi:DNA processing protein